MSLCGGGTAEERSQAAAKAWQSIEDVKQATGPPNKNVAVPRYTVVREKSLVKRQWRPGRAEGRQGGENKNILEFYGALSGFQYAW